MKSVKLLVYADVNLNVMDGSSVWLAELLRLLAEDSRVELDFLPKAPDQGGPLNDMVNGIPGIKKILGPSRPLRPEQVVETIYTLDSENHYDRVFVRGTISLGQELIEFLTGRLAYYSLEPFQRMTELSVQEKVDIGHLFNRTAFTVVQSKRMRASYSQEFCVPKDHIFVLPPLIPPIVTDPSFRNRLNTLCYTGKFSEDWGTVELLDTFQHLKSIVPYAKLNIAGNKFQGSFRGRRDEIDRLFSSGDGVNWVGVVSREESIQLSRASDIGFALRSSVIDNDNSQELSTKLFEYMSAAKPVILRPTRVHKELLGSNYPLYAETAVQAAEKCAEAFTNVELYSGAARMAYEAYKAFSESVDKKAIVDRLLQGQKTTILFAGHDLKFLADTIESYKEDEDYEVLIDNWENHTKHDNSISESCLQRADVVFCEWGLDNIRWYSERKREGQKLLVRMHLQENRRRQFLDKSKKDAIDNFIFIAPYRYEEFVEMHDLPRKKAKMVFNTVHVDRFNKPKLSEASFTLGFVGIVPWRKRFDKALDLFELVWKKDNRFRLRVKGKLPEDYPWMKVPPRDRELLDYEELYERISGSPWANNVYFDGHGDDMPHWFQNIGYLLSTSDFEGSHQAVAEAMASGAIPLMLPWQGAETVYPKEYVFSDLQEIADYILSGRSPQDLSQYAKQHFDAEMIVRQIRSIIDPPIEQGELST